MKYILQIFLLAVILSCSSGKSIGQDKVSKKAQEIYKVGSEHLAFGRVDAAITEFKNAIAAQSDFLDAYIQLAFIYQQYKNDYPAAAAYYEKAIKLDKTLINAYYNRMMCYYLAMDYVNAEKALKDYMAFPNLGPKNQKEGENFRKKIEFASHAVKNPVPFNPVNLGSGVNSAQAEYFPAITADNEWLYFTVNDRDHRFPNEDIFVSLFKDGKWQPRKPLGSAVNTDYQEGAHSISPDGRYLFFASDRPQGNRGRFDIYMARRIGNEWKNPVNLGPPINTFNWESQPVITADSRAMLFVRKSNDGFGGSDIYISYIQPDGKFGEPQNLGPVINTPGDEQRPYLHPDGKTLYFSSTGHIGMGGADVYMSRLGDDGNWSTPVNLGYPINSPGDEYGIYVSADGKTAYFSSDRPGGFGDMDIYSFVMPEAARPLTVVYVKGKVFDDVTKKSLLATINIYDLGTGKVYNTVTSDAITGEFLVTLPSNKNYMYEAVSTGYLPFSENFSLDRISHEEYFNLDVPMQPIESGKEFVLKNIFFETGAFELKPESQTELMQLVDFMQKNKTLKIEIGGHTDNVGSDASNLTLSEKRAKSVYDFLISKGISADRLSYKGYGASRPLVANDSDTNRARNRRTAFRVL
jgi:outer membrane protein OmpA-like peptidoglycan-associated protein